MSFRSVGATLGAAIVLAVSPAARDQGTSLELSQSIVRSLSGGESHLYHVSLKAGDHASLTVDQRGIDVAVQVTDPSGSVIADFDAEARRYGQEHPEVFSAEAATYQVKV